MSRQRMEPICRKITIIEAALTLAETNGVQQITREDVAKLAGCATGLVTNYFGSMAQLRRAVMGQAIAKRNLNVIAQGLVLGDPRAKKAPEELRRLAADALMGA